MDAEGGVKVPTMIIRTKGKFKKGQFRYFFLILLKSLLIIFSVNSLILWIGCLQFWILLDIKERYNHILTQALFFIKKFTEIFGDF